MKEIIKAAAFAVLIVVEALALCLAGKMERAFKVLAYAAGGIGLTPLLLGFLRVIVRYIETMPRTATNTTMFAPSTLTLIQTWVTFLLILGLGMAISAVVHRVASDALRRR